MPDKLESRRSQLRTLVSRDYAERKSRRGAFSLRAYASFLKISPTTLSQLLSGKGTWELSNEMASAILNKINVSDEEKRRVLVSLGREDEIIQSPVAEATFRAICDWRYIALLLSFDLKADKREIKEIAERLGLEESEVKNRINRLLELKLLTHNESGDLERNPHFHSVAPTDASAIVRDYHTETLKLAQMMLKEVAYEERDFTALHFAARKADLPQIKEEISRFVKRMGVLFDSGRDKNDEVFQLSIQCFPVNRTLGES